MVEELELLHGFRFLIGLAGFGLAAYLDHKTRRVANRLWIIMGVVAMGLWLVEMEVRERPWEHLALIGPLVVFFAFAFVDPSEWPWDVRRFGWHGLQALAVLLLVLLSYRRLVEPESYDADFLVLLAAPALMALMVAAYYAGVMVGGADVKALMVVAILAPTYPAFALLDGGLWVASDLLTVPMPFVIFGNSLLCYLVIPVLFLLFNLSRGHRDAPLPALLFGYRLTIAQARDRFVWPMQRFVAIPTDDSNEAENEERSGSDEPDDKLVQEKNGEVGPATSADPSKAKEDLIESQSEEGTNEVQASEEENETKTIDEPPEEIRGRVVMELFPKNRGDTQEILDDLEALGRENVWVTPKTPYMIPLAAAWIVSHLIGDIFFNLTIW